MQPNRLKSRRFHRKAFTLIEVMLVLVILIVLAGMGVTMIQSSRETARKNEATIYVNSMKTPLELFQLEHGRFPSTSEGLDALISPPPSPDIDHSKGTWPYVSASAVKTDPWGQPYQYMSPGQRNPDGPRGYDLWSLGPDGAPDTGDEIGNW